MNHILTVVLCLIAAAPALAIERKPIAEVETPALVQETQKNILLPGDRDQALVWWIPNEYWETFLTRNPNVSAAQRQGMLDAISGTSFLVVVQSEISPLTGPDFYPAAEVEKGLFAEFVAADGTAHLLAPLTDVSPQLTMVANVMKPVLAQSVGPLGSNMHFFTLSDDDGDGGRLIDPYGNGVLHVRLTARSGEMINAELEMPLDSLYVPRSCPNGKKAHVSWTYCPWSGEKLPE